MTLQSCVMKRLSAVTSKSLQSIIEQIVFHNPILPGEAWLVVRNGWSERETLKDTHLMRSKQGRIRAIINSEGNSFSMELQERKGGGAIHEDKPASLFWNEYTWLSYELWIGLAFCM